MDDEYKKPFEGVVDVEKIISERDELDELLKKANDELYELECDLNEEIFALQDTCAQQEIIINQFRKLLKILGAPGKCKACGKDIYFVKNKESGFMPITIDGLNHFADCPQANKFRKGKKS